MDRRGFFISAFGLLSAALFQWLSAPLSALSARTMRGHTLVRAQDWDSFVSQHSKIDPNGKFIVIKAFQWFDHRLGIWRRIDLPQRKN